MHYLNLNLHKFAGRLASWLNTNSWFQSGSIHKASIPHELERHWRHWCVLWHLHKACQTPFTAQQFLKATIHWFHDLAAPFVAGTCRRHFRGAAAVGLLDRWAFAKPFTVRQRSWQASATAVSMLKVAGVGEFTNFGENCNLCYYVPCAVHLCWMLSFSVSFYWNVPQPPCF